MKCTNCGKNNAVSHFRYEINGQVTEAHLCAECASKLAPEREFAARTRELFGDMFSDGFFDSPLMGARPGRGLLGGLLGGDPFEDFFGGSFLADPFAALGAPRIEISFPEAARPETTQSAPDGVDPELSRRRELNALREQLHSAVESEDYEQAARLRDKLRAMEKEKGNEKDG